MSEIIHAFYFSGSAKCALSRVCFDCPGSGKKAVKTDVACDFHFEGFDWYDFHGFTDWCVYLGGVFITGLEGGRPYKITWTWDTSESLSWKTRCPEYTENRGLVK